MPSCNFTLTDLTRQEALSIWLRRAKLTPTKIAELFGVNRSAVYGWLESETIPPYRRQQFIDLGVPAEYLPDPVYKAGGIVYPAETATN